MLVISVSNGDAMFELALIYRQHSRGAIQLERVIYQVDICIVTAQQTLFIFANAPQISNRYREERFISYVMSRKFLAGSRKIVKICNLKSKAVVFPE